MKFPKPIMKMGELMEMGFPEEMLRRAYGDKTQDFAAKMNPAKSNSPIVYDTEGFGAWWNRQIKTQVKGMNRR